MTVDVAAARRMWALVEPVNAVMYFTEPPREAFAAAGLRGFWRGYYAGRAAPLGPVGPAVVTATFFSFAPHHVARAVPEVWGIASPEAALRARLTGAGAALRELLPAAALPVVESVLPGLQDAAAAIDTAGRPMAAANLALPLPDDPLERLWQLCTVLREHRGDGHLAAVVSHDLGGCEVLALRAGVDLGREWLQQARGWTDEEWSAASDRLVARGLLDPDGRATPAGVELRNGIEAATETAATRPWLVLGQERTAAIEALLGQLQPRLADLLPEGNPIGLPR